MWVVLWLVVWILVVIALFVYFVFLDNQKKQKSDLWIESLDSVTDITVFKHSLSAVVFVNPVLNSVKNEMHKVIVGMDSFINAIIINLFAWWHLLVEGVPWLAKTKVIQTFADVLHLDFVRVQFTPDLLPSDLIWVDIYNNKTKKFETQVGPIVSNILLADEINRTPPKVQSALLEAMQEKQVSIWWKTVSLPDPFLVLATQNPLEQEGTYPLPEAQIDRFLFKILVDYPDHSEEVGILDILENEQDILVKRKMTHQQFVAIRQKIEGVKVPDMVKNYIAKLVQKTRQKHRYLLYGASPRASIGLMMAGKAVAFLEWRNEVVYEDIQKVYLAVLRHRIVLNYDAKVDGVDADTILLELAGQVSL